MYKKKLVAIIALMTLAIFSVFSQDDWVTVEDDVFSRTQVNTPSLNKPYSLQNAIELAMGFSSLYPNQKSSNVAFYDLKSIASVNDFECTKTAINSLTKHHYCIVTYRFEMKEQETVELFIALNDGRVFYAKIKK